MQNELSIQEISNQRTRLEAEKTRATVAVFRLGQVHGTIERVCECKRTDGVEVSAEELESFGEAWIALEQAKYDRAHAFELGLLIRGESNLIEGELTLLDLCKAAKVVVDQHDNAEACFLHCGSKFLDARGWYPSPAALDAWRCKFKQLQAAHFQAAEQAAAALEEFNKLYSR